MLGILEYIKSLDSFKTEKPVISLTKEVYQNYYNYYINKGLLVIVGIHQNTDPMLQALYTVTIVNPSKITNVFAHKMDQTDLSKAGSVAAGDFKATVKAIMEGLVSGNCNFDVPYTSASVTIGGKVLVINKETVVGDNLFSIVNEEFDPQLFGGNSMATDGAVYRKYATISEYDKIDSITIPLNGVKITPFKDYVGNDVIALVDNYYKNLGLDIHIASPLITNKAYHKGERVYVPIEHTSSGETETRYYISLKDQNTDIPVNSDSWKDITDLLSN